jgi:hypothetical protein
LIATGAVGEEKVPSLRPSQSKINLTANQNEIGLDGANGNNFDKQSLKSISSTKSNKSSTFIKYHNKINIKKNIRET